MQILSFTILDKAWLCEIKIKILLLLLSLTHQDDGRPSATVGGHQWASSWHQSAFLGGFSVDLARTINGGASWWERSLWLAVQLSKTFWKTSSGRLFEPLPLVPMIQSIITSYLAFVATLMLVWCVWALKGTLVVRLYMSECTQRTIMKRDKI